MINESHLFIRNLTNRNDRFVPIDTIPETDKRFTSFNFKQKRFAFLNILIMSRDIVSKALCKVEVSR